MNDAQEWSLQAESELLRLRHGGMTYSAIAEATGRTLSSVKHKVRRLQQAQNMDRYKHTGEKRAQAARFISGEHNRILETHCGHGGMTEFYSACGEVLSLDINGDRVKHVTGLNLPSVTASRTDSEKEIIRLLAGGRTYDVIDVDPYGFPSRFFPHVFGLIDDGLLFLTFPMMGVAQINKVTIRHYQAFWGIELSDKGNYLNLIEQRLKDYAFMHKREIEVLDVQRLERVYRFAIKVCKKSAFDIVGLKISGVNDD